MEGGIAMGIGIVVLAFTIFWLPLIVLRSRNADTSGTAYNWVRTLALCNPAMNPWVYRFRITEMLKAYRRLHIWCQALDGGLAESLDCPPKRAKI